MSTLLLEIGCEELPAEFCSWAEEELRDRWLPAFGGEGKVLVGPRRLTLLVQGFEPNAAGEEKRGPGTGIAFKDDKPTQAAEGFARGLGIGVEELTVRDDYVWGRQSPPPLGDRLWQVVEGLAAGKTMTWDRELDIRFPRPIRWICAKLDAETITVGPEAILSGDVSYGHRFASGPVEIPEASAYEAVLREAHVEPESAERRRLIVEGLDAIGEWSDPARVLDEVVYLVESPLVLAGSFGDRFLELPQRVIVTAMQSHQRYFPLGGARFAFVANGGDPEVVRAGNERVLEGRLDDATFSYERDVQVGIEAMAAQLDAITFHARAGTFADKAVRLRELCDLLGGGDASGEAARLAKADQASTMVHEFPELEGFIGGEYARLAGVPEGVAAAIAEHYLPDQAGGPLPETAAGRVLSAADKIDNLTVAFALGERPTGSRDPYGLRRAAIGLSRLAVDGELEIDLARLVARDLELLTGQGAEVTDDASDVPEFVLERLEGLLDVPVEFVRAARRSALTELGAVARLARALAADAGSQAFARAYTAFDRANSLAGKASGAAPAIDPGLVAEPAERALLETLAEAGPRIDAAVQAREFGAALEAASELGPPVDRFFDEVHVMARDDAVRANRLRLLLDVRDAVGALGDLSQIPR
ncbi:MAG TPA: glycine--tRNA ligase subunit beta [Gaiellaceae bacterium]|nr:glycine--tRNA ligase subunit beta [Gaiellaceae bacterium]